MKFFIGVLNLFTVLVITIFPSNKSFAECSYSEGGVTVIYFINGVWNSRDDAEKSMLLLEDAYKQSLEDICAGEVFEFKFAHNYSMGKVRDIIEVINQKMDEMNDPEVNRLSAEEHLRSYLTVKDFIDVTPVKFTPLAIVIETHLAMRVAEVGNVSSHIEEYLTALKDGKKVLLIAHSQGNMFAVQAVLALRGEYGDNIRMIGLASPSAINPEGSTYYTAHDDRVIDKLRNTGASVLASNIDNDVGVFNDNRGFSNHSFSNAYFAEGLASRAKIDEDVFAFVNPPVYVDADGDGYSVELGDCDDDDFDVHPGAEELRDGFDNNCDGRVDEGFVPPVADAGVDQASVVGSTVTLDGSGSVSAESYSWSLVFIPEGSFAVLLDSTSDAPTLAFDVAGTYVISLVVNDGFVDSEVDVVRVVVAAVVEDLVPVQVSANGDTSCVLMSDGGIKCWGRGTFGQLGNGEWSHRSTPVDVVGISNAIQVSVGGMFSCALLDGGSVKCWGYGVSGQLGNGEWSSRSVPVDVVGISNATQLSVGWDHVCVILGDRSVRCWGSGRLYQLGSGEGLNQNVPVTMDGISDVVQVSLANLNSCVLLSDRSVKCWGVRGSGVLVSVSGTSTAIQLSTAMNHSCILLESGSIKCWGSGVSGQLGYGGTLSQTVPVFVSGISTAKQVSVGSYYSCAMLDSGEVKCWGYGESSVLGDGDEEWVNELTPVDVVGISTARQLSSGTSHSCVILSDDGVRCWGGNYHGQLGNGGIPSHDVPVDVLFD